MWFPAVAQLRLHLGDPHDVDNNEQISHGISVFNMFLCVLHPAVVCVCVCVYAWVQDMAAALLFNSTMLLQLNPICSLAFVVSAQLKPR